MPEPTTQDRCPYLQEPQFLEHVRASCGYDDATQVIPLEAERPNLDAMIRRQCKHQGKQEPWQIAIVESTSPHGTARQDGIVLLGRKLLQLPDEEIMALVGHEMHHIEEHSRRNAVFRGIQIASDVVEGVFSPLKHVGLEQFVPSWADKEKLRTKLQKAYLRDEEYRADEAGGRFVGNMEIMARALKSSDAVGEYSEFEITPYLKEIKADLAHPFLDDRLSKLYQHHKGQTAQVAFAR
jgi:Zn-dependent protease with chaperone function